jgi:hypothetical protein
MACRESDGDGDGLADRFGRMMLASGFSAISSSKAVARFGSYRPPLKVTLGRHSVVMVGAGPPSTSFLAAIGDDGMAGPRPSPGHASPTMTRKAKPESQRQRGLVSYGYFTKAAPSWGRWSWRSVRSPRCPARNAAVAQSIAPAWSFPNLSRRPRPTFPPHGDVNAIDRDHVTCAAKPNARSAIRARPTRRRWWAGSPFRGCPRRGWRHRRR